MNTPVNFESVKQGRCGENRAQPPSGYPLHDRERASQGMTLVELLVALTLAILLSILAFNLFGITQSAARVGIQRSSVIQQALAGETRLRNDFASIIGPNRLANTPAGAVLIIPALRRGTLPVMGRLNDSFQTMLRSDQLVIFYDSQNGGLTQGASGGAPMTSITRAGVKSQQAKIWLGHVQRASGESPLAIDWALGRQATLLVDPDSSTLNSAVGLESAPTLPSGNPGATLSPANTASLTADVAGYSLEETANWMRAPGRTDAQMTAAFAIVPNNADDYTNQPVVVGQPMADNAFDASDLLGGHRIFLPRVSEVIVQYAADLNFDGLIDTTGATPYTGTIRWYPDDADIFDTTRPGHAGAMLLKVFRPSDDQARVVHTGYYQGPDATLYRTNTWGDRTPYPAVGGREFGDSQPTRAAYDAAMAAYAAHHNGWRPSPAVPPAQSQWPQLIRVRCRLHDSDGAAGSINESFATNRRDDDADGTIDDPTEARCGGIWFEHIFAIPYPRAN